MRVLDPGSTVRTLIPVWRSESIPLARGRDVQSVLQADLIVSDHILDELAEQLVNKGKFTRREAREVVGTVRKRAPARVRQRILELTANVY